MIHILFSCFRIFYSHIIGTKGITRRKLENETRTSIDIPKKGKDGNIGKNDLILHCH